MQHFCWGLVDGDSDVDHQLYTFTASTKQIVPDFLRPRHSLLSDSPVRCVGNLQHLMLVTETIISELKPKRNNANQTICTCVCCIIDLGQKLCLSQAPAALSYFWHWREHWSTAGLHKLLPPVCCCWPAWAPPARGSWCWRESSLGGSDSSGPALWAGPDQPQTPRLVKHFLDHWHISTCEYIAAASRSIVTWASDGDHPWKKPKPQAIFQVRAPGTRCAKLPHLGYLTRRHRCNRHGKFMHFTHREWLIRLLIMRQITHRSADGAPRRARKRCCHQWQWVV